MDVLIRSRNMLLDMLIRRSSYRYGDTLYSLRARQYTHHRRRHLRLLTHKCHTALCSTPARTYSAHHMLTIVTGQSPYIYSMLLLAAMWILPALVSIRDLLCCIGTLRLSSIAFSPSLHICSHKHRHAAQHHHQNNVDRNRLSSTKFVLEALAVPISCCSLSHMQNSVARFTDPYSAYCE